jgi:transposase
LAAVIGVDDWAMRKRQRYGTIIVDLERRCALDLLPDRTADTLSLWLRDRPGIALVARDRSPEYARGIAAGAPDAVQTADRWHLLFNVRQMVDRWAAAAHGRLRRLPSIANNDTKAARANPFPRTRSDMLVANDSRARRLAAYDDVRQRYLAGETLLAITRATGFARSTVRKYAHAETFPERAARAPGPSMIDPYLPYLEAMLVDGCENAAELWREIAKRGYAGTKKQVNRWLQERRTTPASRTPYRWRKASMTNSSSRAPSTVPSPKQLAWLITKQPDMLTSDEAAAIATIQQDPEAARVCDLVRRFVNLIRSCSLQGDQRCTDPLGAFDR